MRNDRIQGILFDAYKNVEFNTKLSASNRTLDFFKGLKELSFQHLNKIKNPVRRMSSNISPHDIAMRNLRTRIKYPKY